MTVYEQMDRKQMAWPFGMGLLGTAGLFLLYFGIVSWVESPRHGLEFFWQDRWIVIPIILGFGVQTGLYTILKKRLFVPIPHTSTSAASSIGATSSSGTTSSSGATSSPDAVTGASGATSTLAMVACCAHHVTDVLPILGLTAATTFLAQYRTAFMLVGLATTIAGIGLMLAILIKERRKAIEHQKLCTLPSHSPHLEVQ